jgi:hypothetical protein
VSIRVSPARVPSFTQVAARGSAHQRYVAQTLLAPAIGVLLASSGAVACDPAENPGNGQPATLRTTLFTDVTAEYGLDFVHGEPFDGTYYVGEQLGSGAALFDHDGDGDLDIYIINTSRRSAGPDEAPLRNSLWQQVDRTFVDVTAESGLGDVGYGVGVAVGDIDNDGHPDVYVTNLGPDALYRNNGDGTFTDVTEAAGIDNPLWGASATFLDFDLDGFLDLFVANYFEYDTTVTCPDQTGRLDYCGPQHFGGTPDVLYHNNGDGTFGDVSRTSRITTGMTKGLGVVSADFNQDGFPDLYVSNDGEPNYLWINQRDGTFRDSAKALGAAVNTFGESEAGMGIAVGDIDSDPGLDLFVTHLKGESNTFYSGTPQGYRDRTMTTGLAPPSIRFTGFGTGFLDFDQDGDLDLAVVNGNVTRTSPVQSGQASSHWDAYALPNFLFENQGNGRFRDVSEAAPDLTEPRATSRGLVFGDVDNDGDIDLLVTNAGGRALLYRNDVPDKGGWLIVRVVDPALKRDAIGATVTVFAGDLSLRRLVTGGYSVFSSSDPRAHFGTGSATAVDSILVHWPGGSEEVFPGGPTGRHITLERGRGVRPDG